MRHRRQKKASTLRRHARRRADTRYGLELSRTAVQNCHLSIVAGRYWPEGHNLSGPHVIVAQFESVGCFFYRTDSRADRREELGTCASRWSQPLPSPSVHRPPTREVDLEPSKTRLCDVHSQPSKIPIRKSRFRQFRCFPP